MYYFSAQWVAFILMDALVLVYNYMHSENRGVVRCTGKREPSTKLRLRKKDGNICENILAGLRPEQMVYFTIPLIYICIPCYFYYI
jgi:hypothetical protein